MDTSRIVTWTWTNWTFGFWYGNFKYSKGWGIDIGPLEMAWRKFK